MLKKLIFSEVLAIFDNEHPIGEGTNNWARKMLNNANNKFCGEWYSTQLSRREVLNILLVWHRDGELELISEQGMAVWEVVRRWKEIEDEYKKKNSGCYKKIMKFSRDQFSTVFLAVKPIKGCGSTEHEKLKYQDGSLVHLDGLHRLIAWAIAGKFNLFKYYFGKKKLDAFVAGPVV